LNISYYINRNGEKQDVSADDYRESLHSGKLICPCCKEKVDWNDGRAERKDGGIRVKCFKHHHGSKKIECENYFLTIPTENSSLKTYAQTSLPLYLIRDEFSFSINIGLCGISESAIDESLQFGQVVNILSKNNIISKKNINQVNFAPETLHLMKVNECSNTYKIDFLKLPVLRELNKKWRPHININGVGENGAAFEYGQYGGKKVKSEDGLETSKPYFLLSNTRFTTQSSVEFEEVGTIAFSNFSRKYLVYKILINVIDAGSVSFCERFGLKLTHRSPQLIPLWPPCRVNNQSFIFQSNEDKYFMLKSDAIENQLVFSEGLKKPLTSQRVEINRFLLKSSVLSEDYLSIGGCAQTFIFESLPINSLPTVHTIDITHYDLSEQVIQFTSSAKVKVIRWKGNIPISLNLVKQSSGTTQKPKRTERIQFLHGLDEILSMVHQEVKQNHDDKDKDEDEYLYNILVRSNSNLIPIPESLKWMMLELKRYAKTHLRLQKMIRNSEISHDAINILKQQCMKNKGM